MSSATPSEGGQNKYGPDSPGDELSQYELDLMRRMFKATLRHPKEFKAWLLDYTSMNIEVPVAQLIGFSQFLANPATTITASESTSSESYTNLTTTGPTVTGLSDGRYIVSYGGYITGDAGSMSVMKNATEASDNDRILGTGIGARSIDVSLAGGGNNSLTVRYKTNAPASTTTFANRWMMVLRYGNP